MVLLAAAAVARIEWALYALIAASYANLSELAIERYGAPSVAKLLFLVVLLLGLASWAITRRRPGAPLSLAVLLLAIGLAYAIAMLAADDPVAAWTALVDLAKNALLACTVTAMLTRPAILRGVSWTLIGVGLVLGGLSAFQGLTGGFERDFGGLAVAQLHQIVGGLDSWRAAGPLGDPNFFAQALVPIVALAADRALNEPRAALRPIAAAALAACLLAILYTYSRGALLALAAMLVAQLALGWRGLLRRPLALAALILALGLGAALAPAGYRERAAELSGAVAEQGPGDSSDPAIRGRFGEMRVAWHMFLEHPLLGIGPGNYESAFQQENLRLRQTLRNETREAHSLYLQIAAELGLPGLLAFAALALVLARTIRDARRAFRAGGQPDLATLAAALGVGWLGYAVTALFLHEGLPRHFWLLVGITMALPEVARRIAVPALRVPAGLGEAAA
ncbi:MAG: O-antigen ligase family protein [Dongiaceae bacterium]